MRGKSNFYKHLIRVFWLSLVIGTVGIWYYVDKSIPDRISVTEHDREEFTRRIVSPEAAENLFPCMQGKREVTSWT